MQALKWSIAMDILHPMCNTESTIYMIFLKRRLRSVGTRWIVLWNATIINQTNLQNSCMQRQCENILLFVLSTEHHDVRLETRKNMPQPLLPKLILFIFCAGSPKFKLLFYTWVMFLFYGPAMLFFVLYHHLTKFHCVIVPSRRCC